MPVLDFTQITSYYRENLYAAINDSLLVAGYLLSVYICWKIYKAFINLV